MINGIDTNSKTHKEVKMVINSLKDLKMSECNPDEYEEYRNSIFKALEEGRWPQDTMFTANKEEKLESDTRFIISDAVRRANNSCLDPQTFVLIEGQGEVKRPNSPSQKGWRADSFLDELMKRNYKDSRMSF